MMSSQLHKVKVIAKYTIKEILQSKILLNVFILGFLLLLVTFIAYSFTYGAPSRIALDFGLGTLSLSAVGIAIFMGINLLSDEINSRTVYMILSRPVSRSSFILGKSIGLISVLFINTLLLSILTLSIFVFVGGSIDYLIVMSILMILMEATLMLSLVSFLSLITSKVLTVIISISLYVVGHSIAGVKLTSLVQESTFLASVIDIYHFILPGFYKINLKDYVLYEQNISSEYINMNLLYGFCYFIFLTLLSIFVFNRKSLD